MMSCLVMNLMLLFSGGTLLRSMRDQQKINENVPYLQEEQVAAERPVRRVIEYHAVSQNFDGALGVSPSPQ